MLYPVNLFSTAAPQRLNLAWTAPSIGCLFLQALKKDNNMKAKSLTLLALLAASTAWAQPVRNVAERASDHAQIQQDEATRRRDQQEIEQFKGYRQGLANALASGNVGLVQGHHAKLVNAMQIEVSQSQAKLQADNKEVAASRSEVRSDNREVRRNRGNGRPIQAVDDRGDRRDDRRDVSDDRRDLGAQQVRLNRQREILATFQAIQVQGNPHAIAAMQAKAALLDEFEQTMVRDMNENVEEIREDHGELREDRRETREDRRQR